MYCIGKQIDDVAHVTMTPDVEALKSMGATDEMIAMADEVGMYPNPASNPPPDDGIIIIKQGVWPRSM